MELALRHQCAGELGAVSSAVKLPPPSKAWIKLERHIPRRGAGVWDVQLPID